MAVVLATVLNTNQAHQTSPKFLFFVFYYIFNPQELSLSAPNSASKIEQVYDGTILDISLHQKNHLTHVQMVRSEAKVQTEPMLGDGPVAQSLKKKSKGTGHRPQGKRAKEQN